MAGEAHDEEGTFTMGGKTDHWKGLRKQAQPRIAQEAIRDGEKYDDKCLRVYGDLRVRFRDICILADEINQDPEVRPRNMAKLSERFDAAYVMATGALANAIIEKMDDGKHTIKNYKVYRRLPGILLANRLLS
jgi:hypothetical protein